jgi:hypothetical protein
MLSKLESELYEKAKQRALVRHTSYEEMYSESTRAYEMALAVAYAEGYQDDLQEHFLKSLVSESNQTFAAVSAFLAKVEAVKGRGYTASWQKKGMLGVLSNLQRKMDRIENIITLNSEDGGESLTENLADLSVYCTKSIGLQAEIRPHEVLAWIQQVQNLK